MHTRRFTMTVSRLALAISIALPGTAALAVGQDTTEHTAHHPAGVSSAVTTVPTKPGATKPTKPMGMNTIDKGKMGQMDQMDGHMKTMQDMHQKFMAAKTPEERKALMPEHMTVMQDAMGMMQGMSGMGMMGDMKAKSGKSPGDMAAHHQMMEKRMEMMQSMMQMMMDRLPGAGEK